VITQVNQRPVSTPEDVTRDVGRSKGAVYFTVVREDALRLVRVPLE
jgi:hypothetical protein